MRNYKSDLEAQLKEIDELISKIDINATKQKDLSNCGIAISKSNGQDQYYWVDRLTGRRKYAKKSDKEKLKRIAQRDYEMLVKKKFVCIRDAISEFIKNYDIEEAEKVYLGIADARKKLVTPIIEPKAMSVGRWKSVVYEPMGFDEGIGGFYSNAGIRVRSKSELIIANMLEREGIPYRYEYPIVLKSVGTVRPDFTCLNVRTGQEFIWEHFGMMDNIAYANKNVSKINAYEHNGYYSGKNMIMTFETSQHAISSYKVKAMIEQYLV
ncbi:MAG: hypothetical protein J5802_05055 [Butyrivibrio sp.]|nr:hypothetical protein [Butyrivibrio sp.]